MPRLIDLRTVKPLDEAIVLESLKKTGRIIAVDTAWMKGGLCAEIGCLAAEKGFADLKAPVASHRPARRPCACRIHPRTVLLSRRGAHRQRRASAGPFLMAYELSSTSWGQEELDAIQRVLRSGRFTMGEQVRLFEDAFAARFGMKHAVMVNSGSSANLVGVAALFYRSTRPLQRGDEVIVPAISWATTFHPLQQYGLKLRFVDVELDTLNMDASKLEAALTPRTRMVVAVSILGNPAPLDRIRAFCDAHDLIFFEDNCESLGASLNGRLCGTFGDVNTFSTFYSHHISTMEGGLLVTNDTEIDHLARAIRNHGWARDVPADSVVNQGQRHDDPFFEAYRFVVPGYNVRPLEIAGAVGLEQLKKLDDMLAIRRQNAAHFVDLFKDDRGSSFSARTARARGSASR